MDLGVGEVGRGGCGGMLETNFFCIKMVEISKYPKPPSRSQQHGFRMATACDLQSKGEGMLKY